MSTKNTRAERVRREIQGRHRGGRPLNSGANRGDWLYATAVLEFGSWGAAVGAAGFDYETIASRPLTRRQVLDQLKELLSEGQAPLARDHTRLRAAAVRHFGSWKESLSKAGCKTPTVRKWTSDVIIERIRASHTAGIPTNSAQIMIRDKNLYAAGRRRFGSWAAALKAAGLERTRQKAAPT